MPSIYLLSKPGHSSDWAGFRARLPEEGGCLHACTQPENTTSTLVVMADAADAKETRPPLTHMGLLPLIRVERRRRRQCAWWNKADVCGEW